MFENPIERIPLDPKDRAKIIFELLKIYDNDWEKISKLTNRSVSTLKEWVADEQK